MVFGFARFIGEPLNATVNSSCVIARIAFAIVRASFDSSTARGVEHSRLDERICRTAIDAASARAAEVARLNRMPGSIVQLPPS